MNTNKMQIVILGVVMFSSMGLQAMEDCHKALTSSKIAKHLYDNHVKPFSSLSNFSKANDYFTSSKRFENLDDNMKILKSRKNSTDLSDKNEILALNRKTKNLKSKIDEEVTHLEGISKDQVLLERGIGIFGFAVLLGFIGGTTIESSYSTSLKAFGVICSMAGVASLIVYDRNENLLKNKTDKVSYGKKVSKYYQDKIIHDISEEETKE